MFDTEAAELELSKETYSILILHMGQTWSIEESNKALEAAIVHAHDAATQRYERERSGGGRE